MTELSDFILAEVHRQASTEAVQAHIAKKIEETVKQAVDSALRWGSVNKQIETVVQQSLALPDNMDLPAYGHMVLALMRQTMDERLDQWLNDHVAKQMDEILKLGAREIKLSDLIGEIVSDLDKDGDRYGSSISVHIEQTYPDSASLTGYRTIAIDKAEGVKLRDCETRLCVSDEGRISTLLVDGKDTSKQIRIGPLYGYQRKLFALYATSGRLIVDDEDLSTGIGDC